MTYRLYMENANIEPSIVNVDTAGDFEPDRFCHPDEWDTTDGAERALDGAAWCVFPWICGGCYTTRSTVAGTGMPTGWTWQDTGKEGSVGGKEIVCGKCAGGAA